MDKEKYFVTLRVAPFVRRYLEVNFGYVDKNKTHFDIREDLDLYKFFKSLLTSKPLHHKDNQTAMHRWRTEEIHIEISEFVAEHIGRQMTPTEQNIFADYLEARCRQILRVYVPSLLTIVSNEAECIKLFYKVTGWGENSWPSKSIRKILERDRKEARDKFMEVARIKGVFERVVDICTSTLKSQNNITELGQRTYEYNSTIV